MTESEQLKALLSDQLWRLSNLYWITDKAGRTVRFKPNWAQLELYKTKHLRNNILKVRQLGISTFVSMLILDSCLFTPNFKAGIVDRTLPDAKAKLEKIKFAFEHLDYLPYTPTPRDTALAAIGAEIKAKAESTVIQAEDATFHNGSRIYVGATLRGGTLQLLHVSELGSISKKFPQRAKEIRSGCQETVGLECLIFFESTHEGGKTGTNYEMVEEAMSRIGKPLTPLDSKFYFFPWYKHPEYELPGWKPEPTADQQKYFEQLETRNVVEASNQIIHDTCADNTPSLTSEYICKLNHRVLQQLELQEDVKPGVLRTHSVIVGSVYRGAPVEDCPYLMERLCTWLNSETFQAPKEDYKYAMAIIQAVCAHIYLAWIHPFGDGNGRTARLVEFYLLLKAGIPVPAAHLLSNHYNKTRSEYYLHLQKLSRKDLNDRYPNFNAFLEYALQGLVDGLREQIDTVQKYQHKVMWEYFVYQTFRNTKSKERGKRMRDLLLSFREGFQTIDMSSIQPEVYHNHYSKKTNRTLQRDLRELAAMALIEKNGNNYRPRHEIITGMLPIKAN